LYAYFDGFGSLVTNEHVAAIRVPRQSIVGEGDDFLSVDELGEVFLAVVVVHVRFLWVRHDG